jgi:CO/xanthine dehydrogenase Mo-binding subunit
MPDQSATRPYVGRGIPRADDLPLLRGAAVFLDDFSPERTLHATFLRSPLAHARIVGLATQAAEALEGVKAVVAAEDLRLPDLAPPVTNPDARPLSRPLLADGVVRFVGEPVAVVVATDPYTAEDAAQLIDLELDPLPPVASVDAALAADAPVVAGGESNVLFDSTIEAGDPDRAFADSAVVVERTFVSPRTNPAPMEGRGALAQPDGDGVTLWSSTQAPHKLAEITAELLGLASGAVRVRCLRIGGGFGQKANAYPEEILVACLARRLQATVKWNYRVRSRSVRTNKCPEGPYRGVGLPVATFVHERLMAILAAELEMDPAEIRRRNYIAADRMPYTSITGQPYDSGDYGEALELALDEIGYVDFRDEQARARAEGRHIGLGFASYVEYAAPNSKVFQGRGMVGIAGFDGAHIALDERGQARVWTTIPEIGQGITTTFAQAAADALGIPIDAVDVAAADTSVGGIHGTGAFASRSAVAGVGAIVDTADVLVRQLKGAAADRLEVDPADLVVDEGMVSVIGTPSRRVPVGDLVAAAPDRYRASAEFDPPAVTYPYAAHACRIEVDTETGAVTVDRYVVVEDCGRILNPTIAHGQTQGAVAQGLGGALLEALVYGADAQPMTASFMDYLLPTASELPRFEISQVETLARTSPNGAKGIGEGGVLPAGAALANAVSDALGVELNELPLTPERVIAAARRHSDIYVAVP